MEANCKTSESGKQKAAMKLLNHVAFDELLETIRCKAIAESQDIPALVKTLFLGSPPLNDDCLNRRFEIYKFVIGLLQLSDILPSVATELVALLMLETDAFPTTALVKIAEFIVSQASKSKTPNGKWLEIFPKVMSSLSTRDTIVYKGDELSGEKLKSQIVRSVCDKKLNPSCVVQLAAVFKDIDLISEEMTFVLDSFLEVLPNMEYQEVPTLIYQLLLFSAKGPRRQILQGILLYFINEDNKVRRRQNEDTDSDVIEICNLDILRQIEGTVILLIAVTSRQDQSLGKEFVALMKVMLHKAEIALAPFTFSVALSLTKVQRYEEPVLELLKGVVHRSLRQKEKIQQSLWMKGLLTSDLNIIAFVKEAINNSQKGWDHVCQGLVKFGFIILDSFGPKNIFGKTPNFIKPHVITVAEQACSLGSIVLRDTFKAHATVRAEIFERILNHIITKSSSPVSHYINVLSQTVQGDPQLLLEVLSKLIEVLDYLPLLPHANALGILRALTPLLKISMPLKDTLMLVLRKALFHRDLEARKIAISGYLTILKKITAVGKVSLSQSQSSISSQASSCSVHSQGHASSSSGDLKSQTICLEIMGILKRALMQQAEVRQQLYEGLYDVVVKNSCLADIVLELLLGQFEKLFNLTDNTKPPLNLALCVQVQKDKTVLNEPIAHLITAIYLTLYEIKNRLNDDDLDLEYEQSAQIMLEDTFKTLSSRLSNTEVDDFEVENLDDLEDNVAGGKKVTAVLLLDIYESFMEYSLIYNNNYTVENCEEFLRFYQKYIEITNMLHAKKNKSSKSKGNSVKVPNTHLTIRFIAIVVEALFTNDNSQHAEGLHLLRSDCEFMKHILETCNLKLSLYNETGKSDGFSQNMEHSFEYFCTIAKVYLKLYSDGLSSNFSSFEPHELSHFFIDGLSLIFSFTFSDQGKKSQKFVSEIGKQYFVTGEEVFAHVLKLFQKLTIKALANTDDDDQLKEVIPLLSIIGHLCSAPINMVNKDVYEWVRQLSIEQTFEDAAVTKALMSLCLTLSHLQEDCVTLLRDISFDIHHHLGDIEPDVHVRGSTVYSIINSRTATALIPLVVHHVEQILDEVDWVLNIMKADVIVSADAFHKANADHCSQRIKEEQVCARIVELISVFNELVQTAMPIGIQSNSVLKIAAVLYRTLTAFTKFYISLYQQKNGQLFGKFEKMVKLSATHLTTPVYSFITYIQNEDNESNDKRKRPKGDATTTKVVREVKTVPPLVFAIELYERHLIILSKKCKKNLMAHMKLSTTRDFRINAAAIEAVLEQQTNSDETNIDDTMPLNADHSNSLNNEVPTVTQETQQSKKRKTNGKTKKDNKKQHKS